MPRNKYKKVNDSILDYAVASEDLEYLYHSKKYISLMEQPRHGACVITTAGKCIWDEGLLKLINVEHERFGLTTLSKLDNTRVKIIIAMYSHAFMSGCFSHNQLKNMLNGMHVNEDEMKHDTKTINLDELSRLCECSKISAETISRHYHTPIRKNEKMHTITLSAFR